MAWLGESLSSLTGHLQNLTKEVLSEAREETKEPDGDLAVSREKVEELEALCATQDLEISALKRQNSELRRRLGEQGLSQDAPASPAATWFSVEQRCDAAYVGGRKREAATPTAEQPESAGQPPPSASAEQLQQQLGQLQQDKHALQQAFAELQAHTLQLRGQLATAAPPSTPPLTPTSSQQPDDGLRKQLQEAHKRIAELESELQKVQQQWLDHLNDAQMNANELRSDIESTRWQLLHESGAQKAAKLRARQDLVNRMIQMGEKNREAELSVKKVHAEHKHLSSEIVTIIQKLGDPQHQELIQGTLNALELENQVLNLRNAQLERLTESKKGAVDRCVREEEGRKPHVSDNSEIEKVADCEAAKSEDDGDDLSDILDLSSQKQQLENQVADLRSEIESYKRDIKHYEMVRSDWSHEKRDTEMQLKKLKEELEECESTLSLVTAQKGLLAVKQTEIDRVGNEELQAKQRMKEAREAERQLNEAKQQLALEKGCLEGELQAMERVVQDLEARLAALEEENGGLRGSLEELDTQHQDALDQLLALRRADQAEKETLQSELELLKTKSVQEKGTVRELGVQVKEEHHEEQLSFQSESRVGRETQTDNSTVAHDTQTDNSTVAHDTQTDSSGDISKELIAKYNRELHEKICRLTNFEVPNDCQSRDGVEAWETIQIIVKLCNEYKWKKDTLERKVGELMKEGREAKKSLAGLEDECTSLQGSVDRLSAELSALKSEKEHLPTILENSEEMEALEQRISSLEGELTLMAEVRSNLEADTARMQREQQELQGRLRSSEAQARNFENLETEVKQLYGALQQHERERQKWEQAAQQSEQRVAELQAASGDLERQKDAAEQAVACADAARIKTEVLASRVHVLTGERDRLSQKCKDLQGETDTQRRVIEELTHQLEESQQTLGLNEKLITDVSFQLEETRKNAAEVTEKTYEDLRSEVEMWKQLASENERRFDEAVNTNLQQQAQISKLHCDVTSRDAEKNELKENLDELRGAKDEQMAVVQALQNNLTLKEEELQQVLHVLSDVKERRLTNNEVPRLQLSDLQAALSNSQREHQLTAEENEALLQQLQREEAKVVELQERIHGLERSLCMDRRGNGNGAEGREADDCATLMEEIVQLKLAVKERDGKLQEATENINKYKKYEEKTQRLRDELARMEILYAKSESYTKDLSNSVMDMDKECEELRERNEELELSHEKTEKWKARSEELLAQNREVLVKHNDLVCEHAMLRERCESLEQEVALLRAQVQQTEQPTPSPAGPKELQHTEDKDSDEVESQNCTGRASNNESDPMSVQKQLKELQGEKQKALGLIEEKTREIELLNTKLMHLSVIIEENKKTVTGLEEDKQKQEEREFQLRETAEMTRETIANLSQLITEKDAALTATRRAEGELRDTLTRVLAEREQLVAAVHQKHQESVGYHAEIQRLGAVLAQELGARQQLAEQHAAALQMLEGAPEQEAELQTAREALAARERELRLRDGELEALRQEAAVLAQRASGSGASAGQEEQTRNKLLQADVEAYQVREASLQRELERLRLHLVEIEEMYTQEAVRSEQRTQELQTRLAQAEEQLKSSSTVYKSASIRANQQVETLQEQARLIAQQRDELQEELSAAEDEAHRHATALRNLQVVLEQFQRDKEREIQAAREAVYAQVEAAHRQQDGLRAEIAALKKQLAEAKAGLSAAARLGEELDRKSDTIAELKQQVSQLQEQFSKAQEEAKAVSLNVEGKVDKSLVKNVVLGYFLAPARSQAQALPVVASVLGLSGEERRRLEQRLGVSSASARPGGPSTTWLGSLLHPAGPGDSADQSLSEAFVRFLESESLPQPQLRLLPGPGVCSGSAASSSHAAKSASSDTDTGTGAAGGQQRRSPLLLADVQLPTFAQLPVGRNSSSILKDILKES